MTRSKISRLTIVSPRLIFINPNIQSVDTQHTAIADLTKQIARAIIKIRLALIRFSYANWLSDFRFFSS